MRALLIMGPTASGKSALALALAERLGGEIVNADAMQVYADLRVLTARPTPAEEARARHHLFGTVDGAERFSVGRWLRAATPVLQEIAARGRLAIVVGGTGLAFKALTEGLADTPEPPDDMVARLREDLVRSGPEALHSRLAARDPEGALRLSPRDGVRIVRALSILESSGTPLRAFQGQTRPVLPAGAWAGLALTPPRGGLYAAINVRFEEMIAQGALGEVAALSARGLPADAPILKAHGAPWLSAHLRGEMGLAEAIALGQRDTRRYAKRQFTWIAHQAKGWALAPETDLETRVSAALRRLDDAPQGQ